jgi:hypothetical protein
MSIRVFFTDKVASVQQNRGYSSALTKMATLTDTSLKVKVVSRIEAMVMHVLCTTSEDHAPTGWQ